MDGDWAPLIVTTWPSAWARTFVELEARPLMHAPRALLPRSTTGAAHGGYRPVDRLRMVAWA